MLLELSSHLLLGDEARECYIADFGIATINEFGICREVFDIADMVVLHQFCFFAAKTKADFGSAFIKIAETGMVVTNLTNGAFAEIYYDIAKSFFVKERAAFVFAKAKNSAFFGKIDVILKPFSKISGNVFIKIRRFGIDIDFPTDAAAMLAISGAAAKIAIIIRSKNLHKKANPSIKIIVII